MKVDKVGVRIDYIILHFNPFQKTFVMVTCINRTQHEILLGHSARLNGVYL